MSLSTGKASFLLIATARSLIVREEIRAFLEKQIHPKSILCKVPPHTGAQKIAETPIFAYEIETKLKGLPTPNQSV